MLARDDVNVLNLFYYLGRGQVYFCTKWRLHPSSRLATIV